MEIDENGYPRGKYSNLIHRQVAYREIYLKHREDYPLPFSKYIIHHKDRNRRNFNVDNLQLVTKEEHSRIHNRPSGNRELFQNDEKGYEDYIYSTPARAIYPEKHQRMAILTHPIVFHLIAFLILWTIALILIFSIMFDSGIPGFFAFLSGFLSEAKWWETILMMLLGYLFLACWWVEWIRQALI
jgi:hypothetical protein